VSPSASRQAISQTSTPQAAANPTNPHGRGYLEELVAAISLIVLELGFKHPAILESLQQPIQNLHGPLHRLQGHAHHVRAVAEIGGMHP